MAPICSSGQTAYRFFTTEDTEGTESTEFSCSHREAIMYTEDTSPQNKFIWQMVALPL